MKREFDLVLVLAHFRAATAFLSVIKHLSPKLRIALLPAVIEDVLQKTPEAQRVFLNLARDFGATVIEQRTPTQTNLAVVQQYPYPLSTVRDIRSNLSAEQFVGMMGFATAGLDLYDAFIEQFDIGKAYVPSLRFTRFLLAERCIGARYANVQLIEVGLPFRKYPIFPEFEVDYIIAAPTVFSFYSERGKHRFLETVLQLQDQIPASARIAYKTHNGSAKDYFAPRVHYSIARNLQKLPNAPATLDTLHKHAPVRLRRHIAAVKTGLLHSRVLQRATPMTQITPYADISLEAFLPGVRCGVIGGLSNTVWGTLYSELPFYNCVDPALRSGSSELLPHRSSETLLDLNLRYFGVPYCEGDIARGARGQDIVVEQDRRGDLLDSIVAELAHK